MYTLIVSKAHNIKISLHQFRIRVDFDLEELLEYLAGCCLLLAES